MTGTREALYGDDIGSMSMGLGTGRRRPLPPRNLGAGEGTDLSQLQVAAVGNEGREQGKWRIIEAQGLELWAWDPWVLSCLGHLSTRYPLD